MQKYTHRIYGKKKTSKRFQPMDLRSSRFVVNLIYASMLPAEHVEEVLKALRDEHPEIEVEARKI